MTYPPALLPDDLGSLTFDDIVGLVERLEFEPAPIDFKEVLDPSGPGAAHTIQSLRRTVCAMANADGGWIIFGVKDRASGLSARDRVTGIPLGGDLRHEFGQKLVGITPSVHFDASPTSIPVPGATTAGLFVARIPVSAFRPHMVTETGVFYRRGDSGSAEPMSYHEVRDQMLLTEERTRRLTLLRLELIDLRLQGGRIRGHQPRSYESMARFDTRSFKGLVADVVALLPRDLSLLRELMAIPGEAEEVNRQLDEARQYVLTARIAESGRSEVTHNNIVRAAETLDGLLARVETELESLFGPL